MARPIITTRRRSALTSLLVTLCLLSSCASTTRIQSDPVGAEVIMDGEKRLGRTPLELEELPWVWTEHELTVRKKGYVSRTTLLSASFDPIYLGLCICTLGILWPAMFVGTYDEYLVVTLQREGMKKGDDNPSSQRLRPDPSISFAEARRP